MLCVLFVWNNNLQLHQKTQLAHVFISLYLLIFLNKIFRTNSKCCTDIQFLMRPGSSAYFQIPNTLMVFIFNHKTKYTFSAICDVKTIPVNYLKKKSTSRHSWLFSLNMIYVNLSVYLFNRSASKAAPCRLFAYFSSQFSSVVFSILFPTGS